MRVMSDRLGETRMMNCGEIATIEDYNNSHDITIRFLKSNEMIKIVYHSFINGRIKSHFTPRLYGVGISGLETGIDNNGKKISSWFQKEAHP